MSHSSQLQGACAVTVVRRGGVGAHDLARLVMMLSLAALCASVSSGVLQFSAPYMVGPSTAVCIDCGPRHHNSGAPLVCGTDPAAHSLNACQMCCSSFFALDENNYIGWGAGINNNGGHFADGSGFYPDVVPIFHSRNGGASWKLSGNVTSKAIAAITGPGQLIPGVGSTLHTMGECAQAPNGSFVSNNSVIFSLDPASGGDVKQRPSPKVVSISGVPLSAACKPHGDNFGHVGSWGLRLTRSGVASLGASGLFATAVACLGGASQTAAQKGWGAASLIGLRSTDGFAWEYVGPVLEASTVPASKPGTSATGPTENDVVPTPHHEHMWQP